MNYIFIIFLILFVIIIKYFYSISNTLESFEIGDKINSLRNYFNSINSNKKLLLSNYCETKKYNSFDIDSQMEKFILPVPRSDFIGIENIIHLATGGEPPLLARHRNAFEKFAKDKAQGMPGYMRHWEQVEAARWKLADFFTLNPGFNLFNKLSFFSPSLNNIPINIGFHR